MSATNVRDRVFSLAQQNHSAALKLARTIADSWYAAQALASVARFAPVERVDPTIREARSASLRDSDMYRVVGSSAWWLRAMIERDRGDSALEAKLVLSNVYEIEHPVSRLEAVFLIFQAVFQIQKRVPLLSTNCWLHAAPPTVEVRCQVGMGCTDVGDCIPFRGPLDY